MFTESTWFERSCAANVHSTPDFRREIHHRSINELTVTALDQLQLKLDQSQTIFNHYHRLEIINKNNVDLSEVLKITIFALVMALNSPFTRHPRE